MGFWSSLFGGGGKKDSGGSGVELLDTRSPEKRAVDSSLSSWITKYLPDFVPGQKYPGSLSAGMSPFEAQGLDFLQGYLNQPNQTPLLGEAQDEISKTLTGGYDPYTSPFYKSLRTGAMQEQQDAQNTLNAQLGSRNKFFSSEALKENRELGTRTTNFLDQILGTLSQQERQNRLDVIPQALAVDKAVTQAPIAKIAAGTTFGALPRQLEQADLEREYQAFLNQRGEQKLTVGAAQGFDSPSMKTITTSSQPSFDWGKFLGDAASAAAMKFVASGCWVAAEVFGSWEHPKTHHARHFIHNIGPVWFSNFYLKYGERIAAYIKNKPILKALIRPIFEVFALIGMLERKYRGISWEAI